MRRNEKLKILSLVLLVLIVVFGYLAIGLSYTKRTSIENAIVSEVIKGRHITVVSTYCENCNDNIFIFRDVESDMISNKTVFYWEIQYNMYNLVIEKNLKYKK